ncbi:MAG: GNAT family N-acetyltransferase [Dehalococcoidia bacterium]
MHISVTFTDDPARVLTEAHDFLASEPVHHNVILTLLHTRVAHPEPGRYWTATDGGRTVGVVFQSPLTYHATITPMPPEAVVALVDAVADAGVALPGVIGDAATAARFAGQWTERHKSAATPYEGQRIYEVRDVQDDPTASGHLRQAVAADRDVVVAWWRAFQAEVGEGAAATDAGRAVDQRLPAGQLWLWDDGDPVSLAGASAPVEGVARIGPVYTPPETRGRGYAAACVAALSKQVLAGGHRCILYTELGNSTSNFIYRRIGYRAVAEVLRYRFA